MSSQGLELMRKRLERRGGLKREDRIVKGKADSLRKSLFNTYQSHTIQLADGRQFRANINDDLLDIDNDDKILSIPFKDICLNANKIGKTEEAYEDIGVKEGDIIEWVENSTKWLVYLQQLQETAYFKASIKRCNYTCNGKTVYFRGPTQVDAVWNKSENFMYNQMNYDARMVVSTADFPGIKRFDIVEVSNRQWEVQTVDNISTTGITDIYLKEYFTDSITSEQKEAREEEIQTKKYTLIEEQNTASEIQGAREVQLGDRKVYTVSNTGGTWIISNAKFAQIISRTATSITIDIIGGKGGQQFELSYVKDDTTITLPIAIKSL